MAGGLTVSVRQVASYPLLTSGFAGLDSLVLVQQSGLGGPYASIPAATLVSTALASGPALGVGNVPPANAIGGQVFSDQYILPLAGGLIWNLYANGGSYGWQGGVGAGLSFDEAFGFTWTVSPSVPAGAPSPPANATYLMSLNLAGSLGLSRGTLSVARDPMSALEVATMGWVGASTVASFNGRRGVVTLSAWDIGCALGYPVECIATIPQVNEIVCQAIQDLIHTYPAVWSWNGRVGDVWLTLDDINNVLATAGAPIIVPTPPTDANDGEAVNAGWVVNYVTTLLAGPPAYATQDWVNTVLTNALSQTVSAFNGRRGAVFLTLADITAAGGAPINSPSFAGVPTAPTANAGNATAQLATTAFVMNAVTSATTGVISFNGRTGAVVLGLADITSVGGAPISSPNFQGTPAAPTAVQGTSTQQIATTAFVMNELAASVAGVATFNGRSGNVVLTAGDINSANGALLVSPNFTGTPTAPTAANGTNSLQLATTAFVQNTINAIDAGVTSFNGRSGAVSLTANDITAAGGLANPSPALIGTGTTYPTSQTPPPGDDSTNIATTAFVYAAIQNIGGAYLPLVGGANMTGQFNLSGNATTGLNPVPLQQLQTYAPLASPAMTGTPTAPTATPATLSTTQLATTAFVQAAIAAGGFATTAQLAGYLPLTGGQLSGPLTLTGATAPNGNVGIGGNATTPAALTFGGTSPWAVIQGTPTGGGSLLLSTIAGSNLGVITLSANTTNVLGTLSASGAITASGASATITAGGAVWVSAAQLGSLSFGLFTTPDNPCLRWAATYNLLLDRPTGEMRYFPNNSSTATHRFLLDGSLIIAGGLTQNSDATTKTAIAPITEGVSLVNQLLPKSFQRIQPSVPAGVTLPPVTTQWGFIAQDVEPVIPAAVTQGPTLGLDVTAILAACVNALKQLLARIETLESNASITPSAEQTA